VAAGLGAHEVMEIHEVLTCTIDGINQFQLYRPLIRDGRLQQMLDHQLQFMTDEYNNTVQLLQQQGITQTLSYRSAHSIQPIYGLDNPERQTPNMTAEQMDDRDVSSCMLGFHKSSASKKILAALECADPQIRRTMQQGALNCSEQAYEVWQFMNQSGFYQVPTMKEVTTNTVLNTYTQAGNSMQSGLMGQQPPITQ
jgi:spore coat protein CotF